MTECEKMKLGLWYDANYDAELLERGPMLKNSVFF